MNKSTCGSLNEAPGVSLPGFAALFEREAPALFRYLLGLLRHHHQAEDAVQEVFLKALVHAEAVEPPKLRGWLYTVAFHQAMADRRRRRLAPMTYEVFPDAEDPAPDPCGRAALIEEAILAGDMLARLPAVQRDVIRARIFEGKRFREIADEFGCPLNTTLSRMHDGLIRLRGMMANTTI